MVNNVPVALGLVGLLDWGATRWLMSAAAVLAGGNVRVGLEDNLWLDKGVLGHQRPTG